MTVALVVSSAGDRFYSVSAVLPDANGGHYSVLRCECLGYAGWRRCKHIDALIGKPSTVPANYIKWTSAGRRLFKQAKSIISAKTFAHKT